MMLEPKLALQAILYLALLVGLAMLIALLPFISSRLAHHRSNLPRAVERHYPRL